MPPGDSLLASLLLAADTTERENAWSDWVAQYSRLILHTIRKSGSSHDDVMDRYAFVLEQLRADDFRRLRTWAGDGRSQLTTWLVIVVRRLCTDHVRRRYGRGGAPGSNAGESHSSRRRLADLIAEELRDDSATDGLVEDGDPESELRVRELQDSLSRVVAALEPADQLMLSLRFRDGRSAADIARVLSLPSPFHVYRRLNHLFALLRRALAAEGVEDPVP